MSDEVRVTTTPERELIGTTLRLVREQDLSALEELDKEVFRDVAYSMVYLRSLYNTFRKTWCVAEHKGILIGYALVGPDSDNTEAWLQGLAVSEQYQGRGLGGMLMSNALGMMMRAGVSDAYITVRPGNKAAYHLYDKFGFVQVGEERANYYGNGEPRKVLHRSLVDNPYFAG